MLKKARKISIPDGWYKLTAIGRAPLVIQFRDSVTESGSDIETYVEVGYSYHPVRVVESPQLTDDIGLCAAAIVLAYYRKTHEHILRDDETFHAALRVEKFLGRR